MLIEAGKYYERNDGVKQLVSAVGNKYAVGFAENGCVIIWDKSGNCMGHCASAWSLAGDWKQEHVREVWLNVYNNRQWSVWFDRDMADKYATGDRIACICREIKYKDREGI